MRIIQERVFYLKAFFSLCILLSIGFADWVEKTPSGTYTVVRYDTMWDLSERFLGDPYQWQELWEANPHIKNPHRIYPGDRIYLPGSSKDEAERGEEQGSDSEQEGFEEITGEFLKREEELLTGDRTMTIEDSMYMSEVERILNKSILTKEFIASAPFLWRDKNSEGIVTPGNGAIYKKNEKIRTVYRKFSKIDIRLDQEEMGYSVGDTLDIYKNLESLSMKDKPVVLVKPNGRAVVTGIVSERIVKAEIFSVWDVIKTGDRVSKAGEFRDYTLDRYVDAQKRIEARVFTRAEKNATVQPYTNFIIDRGSVDGVEFGDLFYIYSDSSEAKLKEPIMIASVVNVQNISSTCSAVRIFRERYNKGCLAVIHKRAVFK